MSLGVWGLPGSPQPQQLWGSALYPLPQRFPQHGSNVLTLAPLQATILPSPSPGSWASPSLHTPVPGPPSLSQGHPPVALRSPFIQLPAQTSTAGTGSFTKHSLNIYLCRIVLDPGDLQGRETGSSPSEPANPPKTEPMSINEQSHHAGRSRESLQDVACSQACSRVRAAQT